MLRFATKETVTPVSIGFREFVIFDYYRYCQLLEKFGVNVSVEAAKAISETEAFNLNKRGR